MENDAGAVRELFERLDRFVELTRFRNVAIAPACAGRMVGNEADRIPRPIRAERDPRPAGQLSGSQRLGGRPSTAASRPPFSADFYPEKNPRNSSLNRTLHLHARDELGRKERQRQNQEPRYSSGIPLVASWCVSLRKRLKELNTLDRDQWIVVLPEKNGGFQKPLPEIHTGFDWPQLLWRVGVDHT